MALDPPLSVGFNDPQMVACWLRDRLGRRLVQVTEARHWFFGEREKDTGASLVHAWLHFDQRPPTELHGGGDDLQLITADPYSGYGMEQHGEIRVALTATPDLLAKAVGRRLNDAAIILGPSDRPACAGLLLRLDNIDLVIGTFCDEWVLALDQPQFTSRRIGVRSRGSHKTDRFTTPQAS